MVCVKYHIKLYYMEQRDLKGRKLTKKGYVRMTYNGRPRMEHDVVWEKHYGEIPKGYQIHHIDGNKKNNYIENLMLVTPIEHKRIHSGCKIINGQWYKPCSVCGEYKLCTEEYWYFSRGCISGRKCKKCFIQHSLSVRKILISKGWKRKNYQTKKKQI